MTLIACIVPAKSNYPILIGDILVSAESDCSVSITTHEKEELDLVFSDDQDRRPVDLKRKIYIINEHLCVAVAGVESELKEFLKDFKIYAKYAPPSKTFISKYVNDSERKAMVPNSIVMILYNEKVDSSSDKFRFQFLFGDNIKPNDPVMNEILGTVFSEGSGKITFDRLVNTISDSGHKDLRFNSIMNSAALTTACVGAEKVLATHTLKDYWGAGYEIIFYEEAFRYLDDIAYVVCIGTFDEEGDIHYPKPDFILFQRYIEGRLLSYSINIYSGYASETEKSERYFSEPGEFKVDIWEIPNIDSIDKPLTLIDFDHSFSTNIVGVCYAIWTEENTYTLPAVAFNTETTMVTLNENGLEILIHKDIVAGTRDFAKAFYKDR